VFDVHGKRGTVTGCRRMSSKFERVDGNLVHSCLTNTLAPVRHIARIEGERVLLEGGSTIHLTRAGCFAALPTDRPPQPVTCCRCLAVQEMIVGEGVCFEDTLAGCEARFDEEAAARAPRPPNPRTLFGPNAGPCVRLCRSECEADGD